MFAARHILAYTMRRRLQQRGLSARRPLFWLPLTMQHRKKRQLSWAKREC